MSKRIVIDPVTRFEGHLRIDVEVNGAAVSDAWASGTMWRGIETILKGRDARDGWLYAQRCCGVCNTAHAIASARGFGFHEAPRGALSHCVVVREGKYENYQAVVPPPGKPAHAPTVTRRGHTRPRSSATPWPTPSARSKFCSPCTRSTRVSRAPSTPSTPRDAKSLK